MKFLKSIVNSSTIGIRILSFIKTEVKYRIVNILQNYIVYNIFGCIFVVQINYKVMENSLDLKNQVCFPIYALAKEIVNHYRPFLDALDITYPQYLVLIVLWKEKEQTVGQLGDQVFLDSGTLTPLLKRMEQKGMINRKRSIEDERVVKLSLTEKGISLEEKAKGIPYKLMESMQVSEEEILELKNIVMRILNKQK